MPSLFFGSLRDGTPADERVVRSTATPYDRDAPAAEMDSAPERGELQTDQNPALGLVNRQVGSHWVQGLKAAPFWKWLSDSGTRHNAIVNEQVASSGTAAAREASGEWGHGTLSYAEGIEPVADLTEGGKLGNEYFTVNAREIQDTSNNSMMSVPPGYDQSTKGKVAGEGKKSAREARAALYADFWNGGQ